MSLQFPIKLDEEVLLSCDDEITPINIISFDYLSLNCQFVNIHGERVKINGYDSSHENLGKGLRVTNLCGIFDGQLLKICPKCFSIKSFFEYGPSYRSTNERRDQSDCDTCRSNY